MVCRIILTFECRGQPRLGDQLERVDLLEEWMYEYVDVVEVDDKMEIDWSGHGAGEKTRAAARGANVHTSGECETTAGRRETEKQRGAAMEDAAGRINILARAVILARRAPRSKGVAAKNVYIRLHLL